MARERVFKRFSASTGKPSLNSMKAGKDRPSFLLTGVISRVMADIIVASYPPSLLKRINQPLLF